MGKIAFMFPGQGAQSTGMGKELYDAYPIVQEIYNRADSIADFSIEKLCFEGDKQTLGRTDMAQPAIFTTSIAILKVIDSYGIKPDALLGLSLGEYTALCASGAFSFDDGLKLVIKRGNLMHEEVKNIKGSMAAVLGLSEDAVDEAVDKCKDKGYVRGANYNCPGQIVVSGEIDALNSLEVIVKELGGRFIMLDVEGPFHSDFFKGVGEKLFTEVNKIKLNEIAPPVVSNLTGDYIGSRDDLADILRGQVKSPVLFQKSIEKLISDGFDTFIEIGPGKTLSMFVKKTNRNLNIFNVEDFKSLNKVLEVFKC